MIFVTVGNATTGFRRLLEAVEQLGEAGFFGRENVFIQSGNNQEFNPKFCKHEPFITMERFAKFIQESNMVICHGGAGTLLHVLRESKVPVVMPRRKQYGELVDDHQMELVRFLAIEGRVIPAYEPEDLAGAIALARKATFQGPPVVPSRMIYMISDAISELIGDMGRDVRSGKDS